MTALAKTCRSLLFCLMLTTPALPAAAADWERWTTAEEAAFSSQRLAAAEELWQALPDAPHASFFLVYKGKVLASFGSETYPYWCHSVRKSFLSALFGPYVENGTIDLDATLAELGIDDSPPLTATERQARVVHLLKARSGVYHEAACEAPEMKEARPARGSHPADTFWYYNNWDFNSLGTIFRRLTDRDIFFEFDRLIGRPLGMQDFEPAACEYAYEYELSEHPCYTFRMSVRDRARFGQLFLQGGRWGDEQIISPAWLEESTRAYSETQLAPGQGYGYMWWTYEPSFFEFLFRDARLHHLRGFAASGYGGQAIIILPDLDMVVVFGVDVPAGADLDILETRPFLEAVLTAGEIVDLAALRAKGKPLAATAGDTLRLLVKVKNRGDARSRPADVDFYLARDEAGGETRWLGRARLAATAPGARATVRLKVRVPADLAPGSYRVAATVDGDKINYDLRRTNNVVVSKKAIAIETQ